MKRIILNGSENKIDLQKLLKEKSIIYLNTEPKVSLLKKIDLYNKTIVEEPVNDVLYSVDQLCNIKKLDVRIKFFLNKKYKNKENSLIKWNDILIKERIYK